jgi:catechol 2,3-dioxygenase-like lactoylglutathione lyase family enzyme
MRARRPMPPRCATGADTPPDSPSMIQSLDHVVITCRDLDATVDFYTRALGMRLETFGEPPKPQRKALRFGDQKFNLHQAGDGNVTDIYADRPTAGSLDLCLIAAVPLDEVIAHLKANDFAIELGPVKRTGARWPIRSIYLRDPDRNLVEIAEPWRD